MSFIRFAATTKQTRPQIHYIHSDGLAWTNCHYSAATVDVVVARNCTQGPYAFCSVSLPTELCQLDGVTTIYLSNYNLTGHTSAT